MSRNLTQSRPINGSNVPDAHGGAEAAASRSVSDQAMARAQVLSAIQDIRLIDRTNANVAPVAAASAASAECIVSIGETAGPSRDGMTAPETDPVDAAPEAIVIMPSACQAADRETPAGASRRASTREGTRNPVVRRAVHQVASATAALALIAIAAGVGSVAVDAFNAFTHSRSAVAGAMKPQGRLESVSRPAHAGVDRMAFVQPGVFAATPAADIAALDDQPGSVGLVAIEASLAPTLVKASLVTPASPAVVEPAATTEDGLVLKHPASAATIVPPRPRLARRNMDEIAALLDRGEDRVSKFAAGSVSPPPASAPATATSAPPELAAPVPPRRDIAAVEARIINAAPAPIAAAAVSGGPVEVAEIPDWQTHVTVAPRDTESAQAARAARAAIMRRNAYGLGAAPGGAAPEGAPSTPARRNETPWYLKKLEWSPFNRHELQSR